MCTTHASRKSRPWTPGSTDSTAQLSHPVSTPIPRSAKICQVTVHLLVGVCQLKSCTENCWEIAWNWLDSFKAHVTEKAWVCLETGILQIPWVYHFPEQHGYDWGVFYHFIITLSSFSHIFPMKIDFNCHSQGWSSPIFQTGPPPSLRAHLRKRIALWGWHCHPASPWGVGPAQQGRAIGTWPAKNRAFH